MKNMSFLQQLVNRPLFMQEGHAASVIGTLMNEDDERDEASERQPRTYARWYRHPEHSHVGVLPIKDVLYHGGDSYWYGQSYESIKANLGDMQEDSSITAIAEPNNCYGGTAAGCGSTEKFITENITKPIYSLSNEAMYSAAYYIAAPSTAIYTLPSAGSASIGTIIQHMEFSEMLKKQGIKFKAIRSGDRKARGGRMEKLDKKTEAELQSEVDLLAGQFMSAVSEHRGISLDEVNSFQGGTFTGQEAVDKKVADHLVATPEDFYQAVAESVSRPISRTIHLPNQQEYSMPSGNTAPAPAGNDGAKQYTQAQLDAMKATAKAEAKQALLDEQEQERKDAEAETLKVEAAELKRSNEIKAYATTNKREKSAEKFLANPKFANVDSETAIAMLEDYPEDVKETGGLAADLADPANQSGLTAVVKAGEKGELTANQMAVMAKIEAETGDKDYALKAVTEAANNFQMHGDLRETQEKQS